jgi:hypothetical protein
MIICITGWFTKYDKFGIPNGKEFIVSHGINENLESVILPQVHPKELNAEFDELIGEWIIKEHLG